MKQSRMLTKWRRSVTLLVIPIFFLSALVGPASAQLISQVTIPLNEYQGSGVSGIASLSAVGNYVQVSLRLEGMPIVGEHPAHIHTGTCEDFDPNPIFPLTTVDLGVIDGQGGSRSLVQDVSLRDLLADNYVIVVHKSAEELTSYFICGDISGTALSTVEGQGDGGVSAADITVEDNTGASASPDKSTTQEGRQMIVGVPVAGSGDSNAFDGGGSLLAIGLGAVALALAIGGIAALMKQGSRDSFTRRLRR